MYTAGDSYNMLYEAGLGAYFAFPSTRHPVEHTAAALFCIPEESYMKQKCLGAREPGLATLTCRTGMGLPFCPDDNATFVRERPADEGQETGPRQMKVVCRDVPKHTGGRKFI